MQSDEDAVLVVKKSVVYTCTSCNGFKISTLYENYASSRLPISVCRYDMS